MSKPFDATLNAIWHFCSDHELLIEHTSLCGCFYCLRLFEPSAIESWTNNDTTALCPYCGMDTLLPDVPLYKLDQELLAKMHGYFFS